MLKTRLIAALLTVTGSLAGCSTSSPDEIAAPTPADDLRAAAAKLKDLPVSFEAIIGIGLDYLTVKGEADPAKGSYRADTEPQANNSTQPTSLVVMSAQAWVRRGTGQWMSVPAADTSRLSPALGWGLTELEAFMAALRTVEMKGPRRFNGTLDLTALPQFATLVPKMKSTEAEFAAVVRPGGQLESLSLRVQSSRPVDYRVFYKTPTGPVTVTAPPQSDVVEAPADAFGAVA